MLRYLLIISALTTLTACSEMNVIGNAAMRELKSDGINVELTSYRYHQKLAALESARGGVMMAKAEIIVDGSSIRPTYVEVKKTRVAKAAKKVKGLWETN